MINTTGRRRQRGAVSADLLCRRANPADQDASYGEMSRRSDVAAKEDNRTDITKRFRSTVRHTQSATRLPKRLLRVPPYTSMLFEVLSLTYHRPITIRLFPWRLGVEVCSAGVVAFGVSALSMAAIVR